MEREEAPPHPGMSGRVVFTSQNSQDRGRHWGRGFSTQFGRSRGRRTVKRGYGRGNGQGTSGSKFLDEFHRLRQDSGEQDEYRPRSGDRSGWRPKPGDCGGWRPKPGDRGGRKPKFGNRGGWKPNSGDRGGWKQNWGSRGGIKRSSENPNGPYPEYEEQHSLGYKKQKKSISINTLDRLTTLQPDLVVFELLHEKSGFSVLVEQSDIPPKKLDLAIKVLARATTSQSVRENVYELLNKTYAEGFVTTLMNYTLTLKRQFPEKGPVFFSDLHTVLETFCIGMITVAITRLINLVDSCCSTLITMETEGHVSDDLVKKYKTLIGLLTEEAKKWEQEKKMDELESRRRKAEVEPPEDFRNLSVLPTPMDIVDTKRPFLRRNVVKGCYTDGQHYLDVQFRLLREDFVRPLREGINQLRSNSKSRKMNVRIYRNVTYIGAKVEHKAIFHQVQLGFFKWMNSKRFMYGNLVCISNDNFSTMILGSVADRSLENLRRGIIGIEFESDISGYDLSGNFTLVESRAYFKAYKHVLQALKEMPNSIPMERYVVHVEPQVLPPQYLNFSDVYDLRVIKSKSMMEESEACSKFVRHELNQEEGDELFEQELDQGEKDVGQKARNLQEVQIASDIADWPSAADLGLDTSQHQALYSALTQELAIIQGPPGTGKTFLGLKIVEILLHNCKKWKNKENPTPILVVCFSNHALDQFLEGMMTFTKNIVRVGCRSQSEKIGRFQINKLVHNMPHLIHKHKVEITGELFRLERRISSSQQLDYECHAARGIFSVDVFSANNIIPDHILQQFNQLPNKNKITHWLTFNEWVESASRLSQVSNSTALTQRTTEQQATATLENEADEDEWQDNEEFLGTEERDRMIEDDFEVPQVGVVENHVVCFEVNAVENQVYFEVTKEHLELQLLNLEEILNKQFNENDYLQYIVCRGQLEAMDYGFNIPVNRQEVEVLETQTALNIWRLEPQRKWQLYNHWVEKLQRQVRPTWKSLSAEYQRRVKALQEVNNAGYLHVMRQADIVGMTTTGAAQYSGVLRDLAPAIVVIEEAAEILESHVITSLTAGCQHLIMIGDHQQLQPSATVYELATKYGLETSLFERLVKNGLAYETLKYQHRMHPSISKLLVPSIYPALKDHPSVHDYPKVLGINQNMFFISHQEHEKKESDDNNSHENHHEAEFVIGLCQHLMLQGYSSQDITILTAYSGQFFLLKKLQRKSPVCAGVRICVVDNYQGEENKIILLSLVRSNPEGKVGFLRTDNRVCVALSRAQHGLYITGNIDLLCQSSNLWKKIQADLRESGSLGEALTLQCENHPHQLSMVSTGQDFQVKSPEGGCREVCAKPLPNCRHSCPKVCHMEDREHRKYKCQIPCPKILCSQDHKCPKLCWERCEPCMVILLKLLPCGHSDNIPCHIEVDSYKCPTRVTKVIPACQHEVTMPCHQDPSQFPCTKDCDTRVDCGHKCKKKCHRKKDPDHLRYMCLEQCTRINVGCSLNHPCLKRCYQDCGSCVVLVEKKLPCGHEAKDVECAHPIEEIDCRKKCEKTLPCGHPCKKLCYEECGGCTVLVKKVVPDCNHTITIACSQPAITDNCGGPCPKKLLCGHPCRTQCKKKCTSLCPELVVAANKCPKGHTIKLPCHFKTEVQGEAAWEYCSEPCDKTLDCEHPCAGTCGLCFQGRLHQACRHPCDKPLVCGHVCKYPCGVSCPPCQEECQWKCSHSKCRKKCGMPCEPCKEECQWRCKHTKCNKRCGEECSRKPCKKPCFKKLKCGHSCVGFCGDPCPPLCRVCDFKELTDFMLLGNEEEADARFVLLEDCGHCIEVEGLEGWLMQDTIEVGMKTCPKCRHAIYNNRRYQHLVLKAFKTVQIVKNRYYKANDAIKIRDIELILQDPKVGQRFNFQRRKIARKMRIVRRGEGRFLELCSVEEKALCYFQAQVLKKAVSILQQSQGAMPSPFFAESQGQDSLPKHLALLKAKVEVLVAEVMKRTTSISRQMEEEVTCELQRLMVLPSYWSFLEKCTVYTNDDMVELKAKLEALMNPTVKFDEELDKKVRVLLKESEQHIGSLGISDSEKIMILQAMKLRQGHWYKCPYGHIYCITECGGAMVESNCPECGSRIGGGNHRLRSDNAVATEMDGARHAAWSEHNNMNNFNLDDLY